MSTTSSDKDNTAIAFLVFVNACVLNIAFTSNENWYTALIITIPLLVHAFTQRSAQSDRQTHHTENANVLSQEDVSHADHITVAGSVDDWRNTNEVWPGKGPHLSS